MKKSISNYQHTVIISAICFFTMVVFVLAAVFLSFPATPRSQAPSLGAVVSVGTTTSDVERVVPPVQGEWQASVYGSTACVGYTRDDQRVLFKEWVIEAADANSFEEIGELYTGLYDVICVSRDKNAVFAINPHDGVVHVLDLDPKTVELLDGDVADRTGYIKDKNGVYFRGWLEPVLGADPVTFQVSSTTNVVADSAWIYECEKRVVPNQESAIVLGDFYGKTKTAVYHAGRKIPGANPETFTVIGGDGIMHCESQTGGYAIDGDDVYFGGKLIVGADGATFERTGRVGYARDKNGEYAHGVLVRNDFKRCSTDPALLPGGVSAWLPIVPEVGMSMLNTLFEFCTMADGRILIGVKDKSGLEQKTYRLFDAKKNLVATTSLSCNDQDSYGLVLHESIQNLQGTRIKLACQIEDACASRDFYQLDLTKFLSGSTEVIAPIKDEHYDCGYRG
ncbi:MAG: DKNYY domain-containing protein [Candidatus Uhrbacteria bacterium]|nr:DKNYY domain-containing protein [Candidatus Uhrbacteria bacterium]